MDVNSLSPADGDPTGRYTFNTSNPPRPMEASELTLKRASNVQRQDCAVKFRAGTLLGGVVTQVLNCHEAGIRDVKTCNGESVLDLFGIMR